jgi:hypothetical protein
VDAVGGVYTIHYTREFFGLVCPFHSYTSLSQHAMLRGISPLEQFRTAAIYVLAPFNPYSLLQSDHCGLEVLLASAKFNPYLGHNISGVSAEKRYLLLEWCVDVVIPFLTKSVLYSMS